MLLRAEAATAECVAAAQRLDCAAIVEQDVALAMALGADGVHLRFEPDADTAVRAVKAARAVLGPGRIVGAEAGASRHHAMALAEAGADYVGLGSADTKLQDRVEAMEWWAELFTVPAVAFGAADAAERDALAAAGADFIAMEVTAP